MAGKKVRDPACPFAGQYRADRIDQASARLDHLGAEIEQPILGRGEPLEPLGGQAPAALGVPPPGAAAAARCIDQYSINLACKPLYFDIVFAGNELRMHI